ncbi:unnamed protein product [Ixodes persulcatus]
MTQASLFGPSGFNTEQYKIISATGETFYNWDTLLNDFGAQVKASVESQMKAQMEAQQAQFQARIEFQLKAQETQLRTQFEKEMRERLDPHKTDRKRPRTEELQHVDETVALTEPPMEPDNEQDEEKEGHWIEVRRGNNAGVRKVRIKNDKPNTKLDIDHRTFNQTMKKAGISLENGARARIDARTNDYIVTTKNEVEYERLCNLKKFTNERGENTEIKVIPGLASNHSRGVIYLRNPGNDMEALCEEIICKTHQVISATIIGKKRTTVLLTFEGKEPPKKLAVGLIIQKVFPYTPRPVVCYRCHRIGHKAETCTSKVEVCKTCGKPHPNGLDAPCGGDPTCVNCKGRHLALSRDCPMRVPRRDGKPTYVQNTEQERKSATPTETAKPENSAEKKTYAAAARKKPVGEIKDPLIALLRQLTKLLSDEYGT